MQPAAEILKMLIKHMPFPLSQQNTSIFEIKVTVFRFHEFCKRFLSEIEMKGIAVYFRAVLISEPDICTVPFATVSPSISFIFRFIYSLSDATVSS